MSEDDLKRDYTLDQPNTATLQEALDLALGAGELSLGGVLRATSAKQVGAAINAAHFFEGSVRLGSTGQPGTLTIDIGKLDEIRELDSTSGLVTVEAGARICDIEDVLQAEGLTLGQSWFSDSEATLGHALRRGEADSLVLSTGAVLPDGTLFHTPIAPRRASGPNPDYLLVGAGDRLAFILWATLRCTPLAANATVLAWQGKAGDLLEALRLALRGPLRPLDARLRKTTRGQAVVTLTLTEDSSSSGQVALAEAALDPVGEPTESDLEPPPAGRVRRLGWRRLRELTAGQGKRGLFVGPVDRHGGWVRTPGDTDPPGDALLDHARTVIDPLQTLTPGDNQ